MELLLQGVCADCRSKAHELHDAISALAQNLGREKRMQSLWQALKGELGLGRVEYLADTLSKHQRALFSVTTSCLWEDAKRTQSAFDEMRKQMADFHDAILTSRQNEPGQSKRPPRGQDSTIDELWEARSALNAIDWEHKGLSGLRQEVIDDLSDGRWRPKSMDITQAKTPKYLRLAKDILRSLNFDHMYKRHDDISKPFESTFK
ncbi:hypothetical protein BKA56DRAFT_117213 [Ilyonectria sp. MPI-CAGE-AT-0026]|nr:hypothetical protein BKA56DRAFT_117213 [Ilyonectria sp. MPI-CAGE-AT-0026]